MSTAVDETSRVIEAERARGAAPDGVPARDLATALNATSEAVLRATFAGQEPAIAEDAVIDTLVAVWINAVYGTPGSL